MMRSKFIIILVYSIDKSSQTTANDRKEKNIYYIFFDFSVKRKKTKLRCPIFTVSRCLTRDVSCDTRYSKVVPTSTTQIVEICTNILTGELHPFALSYIK